MRITMWEDGAEGTKVVGEFSLFFDKTGMFFNYMKIMKGDKGMWVSTPLKWSKDFMGKFVKGPAYFGFSEERDIDFKAKVMELAKPFIEAKGRNARQAQHEPPPPMLPPYTPEEERDLFG